jgi:hypothetical protein
MPVNFGSTPYSSETLPANTFPVAAVFVPNTASGNLTATAGGPASTDSNGYTSAPVAVYVYDGDNVTLGATTDLSTANTLIGLAKAIKANTASVTIGTLPMLPAGSNTIGNVGIVAGSALIGSVELVDSGGTNKATITAAGAVKVDGSAVVQPVSGTITATQGGTWTVSGSGNFTNASIGATGSSVPGSATQLGASDGTNLQALQVESASNKNLRTAVYNGATELLLDSIGRVLIGLATSTLFTAAQTGVGSGNSGDLDVSKLREVSIDLTTTAQSGTNPTIQFFWERKGADGVYYPLWQSSVFTVASNTVSTSIGPGLAYNQSLGLTGRLRWVVGGTATPTWTFSPNIYGK